MSLPSVVAAGHGCTQDLGERAMQRPEVPFPKHWLYYIAIKLLVLAGAVALALRLYEVW
jgi:hypothetical protein